MKAIQFHASVPRFLLGKALGSVYKPFLWSGLSCLIYGETEEPALPGPDWVKIRTRYGGICGSDWKLIHLQTSPYLSPFASRHFIVGHENLGTIVEAGPQVVGWAPGDRVIADLVLSCAARGFTELCPACAQGDYNCCWQFAEGRLSPGTALGSCAETGGSWGPLYVAHQSQLVRVPAELSDENAILLEPLCVALHAVLRHFPEHEQTVLVLGAGTVGLCTVAALRALDSQARILVLAKHPHQGEMARHYGADTVLSWSPGQEHYQALAEATGGQVHRTILGKPALVGGADLVFECVGTDSSVDDALHLAKARGKIVLVGAAGLADGVDLTPIWFHELEVSGTYAGAMEQYQGRAMRTSEVGLDLMCQGRVNLAPLLTHEFPLNDFRQAFRTLSARGSHGVMKAAFVYD